MNEIIAMHGWAGDSNQWSHWTDCFQGCNWKWQTAERGYKDISPKAPRWNNNLNESRLKRVAICHSLGAHLIDKEVLHSATHVVLINSFSRFIPIDKEKRFITIALTRMMNAINTPNELSMIKNFHIKAHKPNDVNVESNISNLIQISEKGRFLLKKDLKLLINTDSLPNGLNTNSKVLVINSKKDYILASQTKKKLAEDLIVYLNSEPTIIDLQDEGHSILKNKSIKKIKYWLESNHANKMV